MIRCKAFRRHVQEPQPSRSRRRNRLPALLVRQHRVQCARGNSAAIELVHLVLHERDQRRDNQRDSRQHDGGKLIAKRFARTSRHHREHVSPAQDGSDERLSSRPKRPMCEMLMEVASRSLVRREVVLIHITLDLDDDDGSAVGVCQQKNRNQTPALTCAGRANSASDAKGAGVPPVPAAYFDATIRNSIELRRLNSPW